MKRLFLFLSLFFLTPLISAHSSNKNLDEKFIEAVDKGDINEVKKLFKEGANLNFLNRKDWRPPALHWAAYLRYAPIVMFLLNNKASVALRECDFFMTPLHYAVSGLYFSSNQDKLSERSKKLTTGLIRVIQLLFDHGIDMQAVNKELKTAYDIAVENNLDQEILNLIQKCINLKNDSDYAPCSICLEHENGIFFTLPCYHTFHKSCIDEWLAQNPTCPNCRGQALPQE